jgi:hypothetical protein
MLHYINISLVILWAMYAGVYVGAYADDQHTKDNLQVDFDKMVYDDTIQKYYDVTVLEVWKASWKHDSGTSTGIYMKVAYGKISYLVPVAPIWYFEDINKFKANEKITILGVESVSRNKKIILPKLIKNESKDLWLRNYDGKPFWEATSKNNNPRLSPGGQKAPGKGGPGGGGSRPSF